MSCTETLRTQAWLDGALEGDAAADVERHIEGCAECQALSGDIAGLSDALNREATHHRAPEALRARIGAVLDAEAPPRFRAMANRRGFWFGASAGGGITALAAGLAILLILPPGADTLAESIADAHTAALMNGRTIEVVSSNHHTVKPWFAGRVAVSPPVADFRADGFTLAGGRVDEIAGGRAAVVAYRHGAHEIDLFVWADRGSLLPAESLRHGYRVLFWKTGDLDFAAVGDTEKSELDKFVALVKSERE